MIVSVVDASNLDRHLYLTTQLLELGRPVAPAVNMLDLAEGQGLRIDVGTLAKETGCGVIALQRHKGVGLASLKDAILAAADDDGRRPGRACRTRSRRRPPPCTRNWPARCHRSWPADCCWT
ncbi:MAG: FeoB small GTPase domain-containing protein [Gemmataceae bacterium]